jgi:non-ribosomal peptide synthetase component E (peptide arylation enzyme)
MVAFLKTQKMSVWKLPERLEVRKGFPMTASGKIQKFLLKKEIAEILGVEPYIR